MNSIVQERTRQVNQYRPEQLRAYEALHNLMCYSPFYNEAEVFMEQYISLKRKGKMKTSRCLADIVWTDTCKRCGKVISVVIRVNGVPHKKYRKVRLHDKNQREVLEHNEYLVRDFNEDDMPNLFSDNPTLELYLEIAQQLDIQRDMQKSFFSFLK